MPAHQFCAALVIARFRFPSTIDVLLSSNLFNHLSFRLSLLHESQLAARILFSLTRSLGYVDTLFLESQRAFTRL